MSTFLQRSRRPGFAVAAAAGLALVASAILAAQPQVPQTRQPRKIGIIGSGNQGGSLGLIWAQAGHEVFFSSRHPEELKDLVAKAGPKARAGLPQDAASFGEVIVIAVPYGALPQVGRDYAAQMKGKVVIELGNPREDRDGPMAAEAMKKGTGVASAEYLPGVRLVRTLNALSFQQVQRDAHRAGEKLGVPVAADDAAAMTVAVQLVNDAGFDPVVVGGLSRAREFDRNTAVYVRGLTARQIREALKLPPQ